MFNSPVYLFERDRSRLCMLAMTLSAALVLVTVTPAHAEDDAAQVSVADVELSLAGAASTLVREAIESSATSTEAAVVDDGSTAISVPLRAAEGVDLSLGAYAVSIGLPESEGASSAVPLRSGAITYPANNGVANTVIPLDDGVQMLTTITSADASISLPYDVDVDGGGSIVLTDDGAALILDAAGNPLLTTTVPWAVDAEGATVPTHYEVVGDQLVQIVEHTGADFVYPIVADPTYTYWWGGKEWWPAQRVNVSLISAAVAGYLGMTGAALIAGAAIGLCNNAGRGIWVYWTWAGQVWCTGP